MQFFARHEVVGENNVNGIDNVLFDEQFFDTKDDKFAVHFRMFCHDTSGLVKDVLTFKIAEEATRTGKNFYEIAPSVKIQLCVRFNVAHNVENFEGECNCTVTYTLEPTNAGQYRKNFRKLGNTISNIILSKYQKIDLFPI